MSYREPAPQQVIDALKRVAANQPGISKEPAPQVYVVSLAPPQSASTFEFGPTSIRTGIRCEAILLSPF
jgi:hypothetical protein